MVERNLATNSLPLRIITHNIRYATSSPSWNERPWQERRPLTLSQLKYHTRFLTESVSSSVQASSFICLQEALHSQLRDLLIGLNNLLPDTDHPDELPDSPLWAHVGVARDDGRDKGEYNPILYPVQAFELLDVETRWLSATPDRPSKGWDAGSKRILTAAIFEDRESRHRLVACNTHLDNEGTVARKKSIPIILETIEQIRNKWADAIDIRPLVFLAGDFNSFPTQEAYLEMARSKILSDVIDYVPETERYGGYNTFTGFNPDTDEDKDEIGRIDFIWVRPKVIRAPEDQNYSDIGSGWTITGYAVLPNLFDDGISCSDHRCVIGDVVLRTD